MSRGPASVFLLKEAGPRPGLGVNYSRRPGLGPASGWVGAGGKGGEVCGGGGGGKGGEGGGNEGATKMVLARLHIFL